MGTPTPVAPLYHAMSTIVSIPRRGAGSLGARCPAICFCPLASYKDSARRPGLLKICDRSLQISAKALGISAVALEISAKHLEIKGGIPTSHHAFPGAGAIDPVTSAQWSVAPWGWGSLWLPLGGFPLKEVAESMGAGSQYGSLPSLGVGNKGITRRSFIAQKTSGVMGTIRSQWLLPLPRVSGRPGTRFEIQTGVNPLRACGDE